jgi:hypothetical protein
MEGNGVFGEGDFVIADPDRGLLVLEVKGGNIERCDGRWFQNDAPLASDPRAQGSEFVRKLVSRDQKIRISRMRARATSARS